MEDTRKEHTIKTFDISPHVDNWGAVTKKTVAEEGAMADKRKYPRCNTAIEILDEATRRTRQTENISLGGCLLKKSDWNDFFPIGYQLSLKFVIPGLADAMPIRGAVRHRGENGEELGIQFREVDKKSAYYIERFTGTFF